MAAIKEIDITDDSLKKAHHQGRNDLLPTGVKIRSPYGRASGVVTPEGKPAPVAENDTSAPGETSTKAAKS